MGATESPAAPPPPDTVRAPARRAALRDRLSPHRMELAAMGLAGALALVWALWQPPVRDLAGQTFRVDQIGLVGPAIWDNLWYGGHHTPGYSALWPPLAWLLGIGATGVLSAVAAAGAFAALLRERFGAAAWPGALWLAAGTTTSLFTGRVVFALGTALAAGACLAAWRGRPAVAAALGVATGAASGVAGAFLVLAGVAVAIAARDPARRVQGALLAAGPAAAVLLLNLAFPEGGDAPFALATLLPCLAAAAGLLAVAPRDARTIRAATALYLGACLLLFVLPTPLGGTMERFGALLVGPVGLTLVLAGRRSGAGPRWVRAAWAPAALTVLGLAVAFWQLNPVRADVHDAVAEPYAASTQPGFYAPLVREVLRRSEGPVRIEVAFTATHWEARWVAPRVAIARGWLRQLDRERNPLFYEGRLTPERYRRWLLDSGVSWVALARTPLDHSARDEARIIRSRPDYLRAVWRGGPWTLYRVAGAPGLVSGPGRLVAQDGDALTLRADRPGTLLLRVRHTRYWAVREGEACVARGPGGWTEVRARRAGAIRLGARPGPVTRLGAQPSC